MTSFKTILIKVIFRSNNMLDMKWFRLERGSGGIGINVLKMFFEKKHKVMLQFHVSCGLYFCTKKLIVLRKIFKFIITFYYCYCYIEKHLILSVVVQFTKVLIQRNSRHMRAKKAPTTSRQHLQVQSLIQLILSQLQSLTAIWMISITN